MSTKSAQLVKLTAGRTNFRFARTADNFLDFDVLSLLPESRKQCFRD